MNQEFAIFAERIDQVGVLKHLVVQLRSVKQALIENKTGSITEKVLQLPRPIAAVLTYLEKRGLEPEGDSAQRDYLEEIITYLNSLPVVNLKLAFEPSEIFIRHVNQVLSEQKGEKVVLNISVNPEIVAGVVIEFGGKFADYSYQKQAEHYLNQELASFNSEVSKAQ